MAALGTFAPGVYTGTYNAVTVGLVTSGGFHLRYRLHGKRIDNTQVYGKTLIDLIFQGMDCELTTIFKEWNAGVKSALSMWANASGTWAGDMGLIGNLGTTVGKQIVLTAQASSPAAAATGTETVTLPVCVLAPDNDYDLLLGPDERDIPVKWLVLPQLVATVPTFFTVT